MKLIIMLLWRLLRVREALASGWIKPCERLLLRVICTVSGKLMFEVEGETGPSSVTGL